MTYRVNDLQRRIYVAVQGRDARLQQERVKLVCGPERWTRDRLAGQTRRVSSTTTCVSTPARHADCVNSEGRGNVC